jgi:hypothetical protein
MWEVIVLDDVTCGQVVAVVFITAGEDIFLPFGYTHIFHTSFRTAQNGILIHII